VNPNRPHLVISPGRGNSGPDHWQAYLEREWGNTSRVRQMFWRWPTRRRWVAAIERQVRDMDRPLILVGHSAGALSIVEWALRGGTTARILGALLVAPPDMEDPHKNMPAMWFRRLIGWTPISRGKLPFPSILVTSTNDHYGDEENLQKLAGHWGSRLVSLGQAGHINQKSGHGPWPLALQLIEELTRRT